MPPWQPMSISKWLTDGVRAAISTAHLVLGLAVGAAAWPPCRLRSSRRDDHRCQALGDRRCTADWVARSVEVVTDGLRANSETRLQLLTAVMVCMRGGLPRLPQDAKLPTFCGAAAEGGRCIERVPLQQRQPALPLRLYLMQAR